MANQTNPPLSEVACHEFPSSSLAAKPTLSPPPSQLSHPDTWYSSPTMANQTLPHRPICPKQPKRKTPPLSKASGPSRSIDTSFHSYLTHSDILTSISIIQSRLHITTTLITTLFEFSSLSTHTSCGECSRGSIAWMGGTCGCATSIYRYEFPYLCHHSYIHIHRFTPFEDPTLSSVYWKVGRRWCDSASSAVDGTMNSLFGLKSTVRNYASVEFRTIVTRHYRNSISGHTVTITGDYRQLGRELGGNHSIQTAFSCSASPLYSSSAHIPIMEGSFDLPGE